MPLNLVSLQTIINYLHCRLLNKFTLLIFSFLETSFKRFTVVEWRNNALFKVH